MFFTFSFLLKVGNAVPPPMAAAIGLEIKKCVIAKAKEERNDPKKQDQLAKILKPEASIKTDEVGMDWVAVGEKWVVGSA